MKFLLSCLLLMFCLTVVYAQQEVHHKVKVYMDGRSPMVLENLGLEADHGIIKPGVFIINDYSESEVRTLEEEGFRFEILVRDVSSYYLRRNQEIDRVVRSMQACQDPLWEVYDVPANFTMGSMGGYHTLDEILANLDQMHQLYPDLISEREPISALQSHEGHNIYWMRISNIASTDQQKPKALYTSLHHAREPASVSQMLFFMWYLLENYDSDEEVSYLLNNTELYFIPCVNPDGYLYNEAIMPNGGGMWRKNRRLNANGTYGVDLNRNYGYMWGANNMGSSPNPAAQTYRGPAPFSEPELENIRIFVEAREFRIALNYHTFGNLLIHPWGFTSLSAPDASIFSALGDLLTNHNHYHYGTDVETVGYSTNGSSDDWMYGDTVEKPAIFAFTPEVGDEFWPPSSFIQRLCKENVWQNLATAHTLLKYGKAEYHFNPIMTTTESEIEIIFTRYGFEDGPIKLKITPLTPSIASESVEFEFNLEQGEHDHAYYSINLSSNIETGTPLMFLAEVILDSTFSVKDTLHLHFDHFGQVVVEDYAADMSNWITDGWGLAFNHYVSAPSSINDSPGSFYSPNATNTMQWDGWIDLEDASHAVLNFWARWHVETNYDYVQLHIRKQGGNWEPLCGLYSKPGSNFQATGEPVWDGLQSEWVLEYVDLSAYTGNEVQIKWTLISDSHIQYEGFYMDNLQIMIDNQSPVSVVDENITKNWHLFPNPANGQLRLVNDSGINGIFDYRIYNMSGHVVMSGQIENNSMEINTSGLPGGNYLMRVYHNHVSQFSHRFVLVR